MRGQKQSGSSKAADEWRRSPILPIVGAVGYATGTLHLYSIGSYLAPIADSFGWSRAMASSGLTVATLVSAALSIPMGLLVDRYGPRLFALIGIVAMSAAFAAVGLATGGVVEWYLLWALLGVASLPVQAIVWTSAIVANFHHSRGLALAVTMSGSALAPAVFPLLGSVLIENEGWRKAIQLHGVAWGAFALPIIYIFFLRGKKREDAISCRTASPFDVTTLMRSFSSSVYLRLLLVSVFLGVAVFSVVIHFVPILIDGGATRIQAAGTASVVGISAAFGRITAGLLLDRVRATLVGMTAFLLAMCGCVLLLFGGNQGAGAIVAAACIGLTLGAEVDVIAYLTSRYFGLERFGTLFGGQLMASAFGVALGPLTAAATHDYFGTYSPFLWFAISAMAVCSIAIASLPRYTLENTPT